MNGTGKLTYHDFVQRVSQRVHGDPAAMDRFLHRLGPVVENALANDGSISLAGFGHFDLRHMDERSGRNPQNGETIAIPAHTQVHFTPFQALKWAVNWPYRSKVIRMLPFQSEDRPWSRPWIWLMIGALLLAMVLFLALWSPWNRGLTSLDSVPAVVAPVMVAELPAVPPVAEAALPTSARPLAIRTVVVGDNFWNLADRLWQTSALWPLLYAENRAALPVMDPDRLPVGIQLQIPTLEGNAQALTAEDIQRLSAAYALVGQDYQQSGSPRSTGYLSVARRGFQP